MPRGGRRRREGTRWFADIHAGPQAYHAGPDAVIHRSAWKGSSRKVTSKILHMSRHRDTFWSSEAEIRRKGDHNSWCRGYKYKITNVAFVAAKEGVLAALVYSLV